jgi:diguanylate cyclase (GGDEF)-like protein
VNINQATKELRVANEKLQETAQSDFLTSLANRRYFEMDLGDIISRDDSGFDHVSLLLFDIDNFKTINDNFGHAAGDEVLTHVAGVLESFMRQGDVVARYAGDEFVIRFSCDGRVAVSRANQIRQAIENLEIQWRNRILNITVSIGIYSVVLADSLNVKEILHNVDIAMYEAKKRGRNCVKTYKREMAIVKSIG